MCRHHAVNELQEPGNCVLLSGHKDVQPRLDYCNALFTGMSESSFTEASTCLKHPSKSHAEEGEV